MDGEKEGCMTGSGVANGKNKSVNQEEICQCNVHCIIKIKRPEKCYENN